MMTKAEYLKEWKRKKAIEDPDYFKRAGKEAFEKRKEFLKQNPDIAKEVYDRSLKLRKESRKRDPRVAMLADARKRAKKKGLEYNLSVDDIQIPDVCPVLGIELSVGDGERHYGSPSIDRIDNSKGYVKGNVAIISLRANSLKNNGSVEELKAIVKYMEEHHGMVRN